MQKGQSLIEVLVGLATAVIIVGAITAATISALSNAIYSKNQTLATNYAQQGMEIVRNLRDRNYQSFSLLQNGTYCLAKTCNAIDPPGGQANDPCGPKQIQCDQNVGGENADIFVRQVTIDQNATSCQDGSQQATQVTVDVSWFDAKCGVANGNNIFCHNVNLSTCLSTYNTIPAQ